MGQVNMDNVKEVVTYHAPTAEQLDAYKNIRAATEILITTILSATPNCADQSAAIRKAREAMMTANAAVALRGMV